ncbi:uncharacterized protein [Elaeis guineensis]|uniref:uncharacterized protein isoform X4 n=1 Tax=Elaeis guineensis var. tenera TaxID=51953 RepID=UPI003C6D8174
MANQGAKKRKEENKKHMAMLLRVIIASNIPAFGAYKVLGLLKGILSECSKNCLMEKEVELGVEDEKSWKKREKMEKKAARGKIIRTRNR